MKKTLCWRAWIATPIPLAIACFTSTNNVNTATLLWDPNTETNLAGYCVYIGVASRSYDTNINVGIVTNWPIVNLRTGVLHFIAVTAYDTEGLESDFSEEVSYTPGQTNSSSAPSLTMLGFDPQGCARLLARGLTTQTYRLEASADLRTWTTIRVFVAETTESMLTDCTTNQPQRYYRLAEELPPTLLITDR